MHDKSVVRPVRTGLKAALYDNAAFCGERIRVVAFGRPYDCREQDWTFRNLQRPEDGKLSCSVTKHLPAIAKDLRINEILAPVPDFGAKICYPAQLNVTIPIGDRLVLRRGTRADGARLMVGQTYAISVGGCGVLVLWYPHKPRPGEEVRVVVAHAGFNSLFDRSEALHDEPSRTPESVVTSALTAIGCWKKPARRKRVGGVILFPISPEQFRYPWDHPEFGADNRSICLYLQHKFGRTFRPHTEEDGCIDIGELASCQLAAAGVPVEHITLATESDSFGRLVHNDGTPMWYNTRGPFPKRRNLLIIQRYA